MLSLLHGVDEATPHVSHTDDEGRRLPGSRSLFLSQAAVQDEAPEHPSQGQVTPGLVVIAEVVPHDSTQVSLPKHDDVIETFSAQGPITLSTYGVCQGLCGR